MVYDNKCYFSSGPTGTRLFLSSRLQDGFGVCIRLNLAGPILTRRKCWQKTLSKHGLSVREVKMRGKPAICVLGKFSLPG